MSKKIRILVLILVGLAGLGYFALTRGCTKLYFAGQMINKRTFDNEKKLGATIRFATTAKGWIRTPLKVPMDDIWRDKIGRKGMNYFLVGAPSSLLKTYSSRFDPESRYYQAWFGCYTVLDEPDGHPYGFENGQPVWEDFIYLAGED